MAMELFLLRHGEAVVDPNVRDRIGDLRVLSEKGREQAIYAARCLQGAGLTHVISSPMMRAVETAQPLSRITGLPVVLWTDAYEKWKNAPYRGLTPDAMKQKYPEVIYEDEPDPEGWYCSGWETLEDLYRRAGRLVARLKTEFSDQDRVALIAHGSLNHRIMLNLLQVGPEASFRANECNCCIWWFGLEGTSTSIRYLGEAKPLF